MIVDNLDKILGLFGLMIGIELIAIVIFTVSILYIRNPVAAGLIGNISSLTMTLGIIGYAINRDRK
ncbi:hypothetical protein [Methanobacterium spitsbergense]|uniref:Uncharacterized protein n=1 Tax=Methanobacterium spitsbergense TaxID=2874285 RepID=A0A8T5UNA2_9EURY|nr:hypothetical protein [Methanobacterium spitsbergense]MBZ2165308.1 hypothetical protein [Methanobacterium spitsbergense]